MILIEAEGDLSITLIDSILQTTKKELPLIVSSTRRSENRGLELFCLRKGIPFSFDGYNQKRMLSLSNENLSHIISIFGRRKIPVWHLKVPEDRTFNIHPSLLPNLRGCFSIPWAIILGLAETGVTYHTMTRSFDTGKIFKQYSVPINEDDTAYSLAARVKSKILSTFPRFLSSFLSGSLESMPQLDGGSYYPRVLPFDGKIDLSWDEEMKRRFIAAMIYPPYKGAIFQDNHGVDHTFYDYEDFKRFLQNR